ncbi:MAG: uracil-DNA glycosylase [Phycisphaerales bacterium]
MEDALAKSVRRHAASARMLGAESIPCYPSASRREIPAPPPATEVTGAPPIESARPKGRRDDAPVVEAGVHSSPAGAGVIREAKPRGGREERAKLLDDLRARYESDAPHKRFVTAFTNIVFGDGDPCARLMFVGEAPGAEEDRTGKPFVGRAGELLNKMIGAMGLDRGQVYIANVLKTRPPDNATPTSFEIDLCRPYLMEQIEIIGPEAIVALGLPASRALLGTDESMGRMRGRWHSTRLPSGGEVAVMPTYHPAYVLRNYTEDTRAKVWADLKMAMDRLGLSGPAGKKA